MISGLASFHTKIVRCWLPDAFLFAIMLTFIVFGFGIVFQNQSPVEMAGYWGDGFWKLLAFAMQMVLFLVTGQNQGCRLYSKVDCWNS
jgi:short-chain fatty acids transporter